MSAKGPVRQIAGAVERHGGDISDVQDLVRCFERLHSGLEQANALHHAGDELVAEDQWQKLEDEFARPLDEIIRDHLERE
ncbi:MAG TPA: hypothetical protein VKG38_03540 [Solirubrobacteraceae bacterium]|nr:hypothetical protein [Solirubrobacteraceae bacterium]